MNCVQARRFAAAVLVAAVTTAASSTTHAEETDSLFPENVHVGPIAGGEIRLADSGGAEPSHGHSHGGSGYSVSRPDGHAPIGVRGDHMHGAGEVMLSYRFMQMHMSGNRDGGSNRSDSEVLADFMIAPTEMDMKMHMIGVMYAPVDYVTLTLMGSVVENEMSHVTRSGVRFKTKASGFGDTRVGALVKIWEGARESLHLNTGVSLPTGSTDEQDATPMGPNTKLPYPMQLGSGTYDLLPGLTYNGQDGNVSWGAQANGTIRLGENSDDYTLGNQAEVTTWSGFRWTEALSTSLRLDYRHWENIDGRDPELPAPSAMIVPTADPDRRGGDRLDMLFGINVYGAKGPVRGHRIAFEMGFPVFQDLDGPQLETDWVLTAGWQFSH